MDLEFTLEQIKKAAEEFWAVVREHKVIAFHGAMGSGKTTFIHALCDVLKVNEPVTSPTFAIINEYTYSDPSNDNNSVIYHMDLYRINSEEEARQAGIQDCLFSGNICLIEWPEKIPHLFPPETMHVFLTVIDSNTRSIHI